MKLWKDDRIDGEYEMTIDELARGFLASGWVDVEWPYERKLVAYLTSGDRGGLRSSWDDLVAFDAVVDFIVELRSAKPTRPMRERLDDNGG